MRAKIQNSKSLNNDSSPSSSREQTSKYQPLTWSDDSEGSTQGSGNESGKQHLNIVKGFRGGGPGVEGFTNNEDRNKVRFMSSRLPATASNNDQPFEAQVSLLKPILKNSSGYSSCEDSAQKDLYQQRTLPQRLNEPTSATNGADLTNNQNSYFCSRDFQNNNHHQGQASRPLEGDYLATNSPSAHDQNVSLTSQYKAVRPNSNIYDHQSCNQNLHQDYLNQEDLPRPAGRTEMFPIPTQRENTYLEPQSQNMIQNYDAPSGQQCRRNVSNIGSNFTKQIEIHLSTPQSPSIGHSSTVNQRNSDAKLWSETSSAQYSRSGLNTSGHHSATTDSVSSIDQRNVNSTFSRQSMHKGYHTPPVQNPCLTTSTVKQNSPDIASTFPKASELNDTGYGQYTRNDTSHLGSTFSRSIQSESLAPSAVCSRPNETHQTMASAAFAPQSWQYQSQTSFNHTTFSNQQRHLTTGNIQNVPSSKPQSTPSISQQRPATSSSGYSFSHPSYKPASSNQNMSLNSHESSSSFSTYGNVSQDTAKYPSMSTVSTQPQSTPLHRDQQPNMNIFIGQSKDLPVTTSQVPQNPVSSVQATIGPYGHPVPRMSQGRNIPTNAVPYPTVPVSQSQTIIVPRSTVQRQSQCNPVTTPGYSNVPVCTISPTGVSQCHVRQSHPPPTQSKYIPGITSEYPNVPSYQQSISQRPSQYGPKSTSNVPTNQPQSSGAFFGQQQKLPPKQSQYNPANTSECPNVTNYQPPSSNLPPSQQDRVPSRESECVPKSGDEHNFQFAPTSSRQNIPAVPTVYPNESNNQLISTSSLQRDFPPSCTSGCPNVPVCKSLTKPLPSPIVHNSMVQSLDSLRNTSPSQRLPTGVAPSVTSYQSKSPSNSQYPSSSSENFEESSKYQPIQCSQNISQHIQNNQEQSRFNPKHATQHNTTSQTSTPAIQKQSVQTPSIYTSPKKSPRIPSLPMPDPELCKVRDDIIAHGVELPSPLAEIDSQRFPASILRSLRDLRVIKPSSFQANIWPAILRGRDVFGIPEKGSENVMAYLPPIITQLAEPGSYSEVPLGNGVRVFLNLIITREQRGSDFKQHCIKCGVKTA